MSEQESKFERLTIEALAAQVTFERIPEEQRPAVVHFVTDRVTMYDKVLMGRWNSVSFDHSTVVVRGVTKPDDRELVNASKRYVKDLGIHGHTANTLIQGAFRNTVYMLQARVETMQKLAEVRSMHRRGVAGGEGRQMHTKTLLLQKILVTHRYGHAPYNFISIPPSR